MNPLAVLLLLGIAGAVFFARSRRGAALALLAGMLFLPQSISISISGVNFFGMRLIEVVAAVRIVSRGELSFLKPTLIDKALAFFFAYSTIVFVIRSNEGFAYQIGLALDGLLCFGAFRIFIPTIDDMRWLLRAFIWLLVPFTGLVLIESITQQNPFAALGGIMYGADWMRNGRLRCQGSFQHCSLLGTLGASFLSLYLGLVIGKIDRKTGIVGIILCIIIVWASNSGAPLSCVATVAFCWMIWPVRQHIRLIRRALFVLAVLVMFVMKAPIYYFPAKVSSITGGDGWHRSYLMEVSVRDLHKWWLAGMPLSETAEWFPYTNFGTGFADITNQFVSVGLSSGLPAMLLFMLLLIVAFVEVRKILKFAGTVHKREESGTQYITWGLGSVLIMHISNWLGIIYFDQTYVIWYLHLAMVGSLSWQARVYPQSLETNENYLVAGT